MFQLHSRRSAKLRYANGGDRYDGIGFAPESDVRSSLLASSYPLRR
jgi:hypothetical protein